MLDLNYLSEVVHMAQGGDSNAFAEIYAATYKKQYAFALGFLGDRYRAQDALQECYERVYNGLSTISGGYMLISWITQNNFEVCAAYKYEPEGIDYNAVNFEIRHHVYTVRQALRLTATESMCVILRYFCGLTKRQAASLLELKRMPLGRYTKSGRNNLYAKEQVRL